MSFSLTMIEYTCVQNDFFRGFVESENWVKFKVVGEHPGINIYELCTGSFSHVLHNGQICTRGEDVLNTHTRGRRPGINFTHLNV